MNHSKNMNHSKAAVDTKAHFLVEAIDQLGDYVWKTEIWASALLGLASSVPAYESSNWLHSLAALAPVSDEPPKPTEGTLN
jgi:hypothetical protein